MTNVVDQPKITQQEFLNYLKSVGTTVTKNTFGDALRCNGLPCWRRNAEYDPKHIIPTVKHGGESIMVWVCFSTKGTKQVHCIKGQIHEAMYHKTLDKNRLPSTRTVFRHDNDPKKTTKPTRKWLKRSRLRSWSGLASLQTTVL